MAQPELSGHLLCTIPFAEPKQITDRIRARHPNLKITYHDSHVNIINWRQNQGLSDEVWKDITVLCTLSDFPPPKAAPQLGFIQLISAGTDHMLKKPIYTDSQVPITTANGIHGPSISEWVMMTCLVASRKHNVTHGWQQVRSWGDSKGSKDLFRSVPDNAGKRFGILGYGSIGRQTARLAQAMGMDVVVFTMHPRDTPESKRDTGYIVPGTGDPDGTIPSAWFSGSDKPSLHRFLGSDLDYLLVSLPLTPVNKRLLGKAEFDVLSKKNAFLINVSRGEHLVQDDLIKALEDFESDKQGTSGSGRKGLRGAALDVTTPEPLPKDSPLWDAPNCIIAPHISGLSSNYGERAIEVLEANLERHVRGQRLLNLVDRGSGYASKYLPDKGHDKVSHI